MPRDEDDDERPRRRNRRDEEDDERPRGRSRRNDDDEDEEERPRRREYDEDDDEDDYEPGRRMSRETLRAIAGNQKAIILCILVYLCFIPAQFLIPEDIRLYLAFALLPLGVTATVFVFLLATKVYSTAAGVILALFTLIPCIGLIVLLIINGKATSVLKAKGIRVGLLGARMSDI